MIVKFNDTRQTMPEKVFVRTDIDTDVSNDDIVLVGEREGTGTGFIAQHANQPNPGDVQDVDINEYDIPRGQYTHDTITYSDEIVRGEFDLVGNTEWTEHIQELIPELRGLTPGTEPTIDTGDVDYYDFNGSDITAYSLQELRTRVAAVGEQVDQPTFPIVDDISPVEYYNTYLINRYAQIHYFPVESVYFVMPFADAAQSTDGRLTTDVLAFPQIDMGELTLAQLEEMYPDCYVFSAGDFAWLRTHIDVAETELTAWRTWSMFSMHNAHIMNAAKTIDDLRNFRTWLAQTLHDYYNPTDGLYSEITKNSDDTEQMVMYYADGMYDAVVRGLSLMNMYQGIAKSEFVTGSSCLCGTTLAQYNSNIAKLFASGTCNPIDLYRKGVYSQMVKDFGTMDFWLARLNILPEFKEYIDGIIANNFPLSISGYSTSYCDCDCLTDKNAQSANMSILVQLSTALQYCINGELDGHKNFINRAFSEWASKLYEMMQWA